MHHSLTLGLILFTSIVVAAPAWAQVCSGNVFLNSQEEVDAFACSEITANLTIDGTDISSLLPLSGLTSVGETIIIGGFFGNAGLESLEGLEGLASVGFIRILENDALESLAGLENLTSVGGITIEGNDALESLAALANLTSVGGIIIEENDALGSLTGLGNLSAIGGRLHIISNESIVSLSGLENLTLELTRFGGRSST